MITGTVLLGIFSVITGAVSLWGAGIQVMDRRLSQKIAKATRYPIKIRRSISSKDYDDALAGLQRHILNVAAFNFDVVIGVNYRGMGPASELAATVRKPLKRMEVSVATVRGVPQCESVRPEFDLESISGKSVLIVDNSIRSGRTLREVVRVLHPYAQAIQTVVVYRPSDDAGSRFTPDFVLFASEKPLASLKK